MAKLRAPDLPAGSLRELFHALHALHARAGWPSTRELAKHQNFSHTVVHNLFTRGVLPPLPVLHAVVQRMAAIAPSRDQETISDEFDKLWTAAFKSASDGDGPPPTRTQAPTDSSRQHSTYSRSPDHDNPPANSAIVDRNRPLKSTTNNDPLLKSSPHAGVKVVRRRLGQILKQLRAEQGLTTQAVAEEFEISVRSLQRLETGQAVPKVRLIRDLLAHYHAPEEVQSHLLRWANEAKGAGWWQPFTAQTMTDLDEYISLETEARSLKMYSTQIPALLQTNDYARAVVNNISPQPSEEKLEQLTSIRMRRQQVLAVDREEAAPLDLHVILDEATLYRAAHNVTVMHEQLQTLLEFSSRPNVALQIFPFTSGYDEAVSTFAIFEPREAVDSVVINVENIAHDTYLRESRDIARLYNVWQDLVARSLDPATSRTLIDSVISERY